MTVGGAMKIEEGMLAVDKPDKDQFDWDCELLIDALAGKWSALRTKKGRLLLEDLVDQVVETKKMVQREARVVAMAVAAMGASLALFMMEPVGEELTFFADHGVEVLLG